jgi:chlorite dismutase
VPEPLLVSFAGGDDGAWRVERITPVTGLALAPVTRLAVFEGRGADAPPAAWALRGVTSNERYVESHERVALRERQQGLGRVAATCAALIPITKASAWWDLTQDERRAIFETRSAHIAVGLAYLPQVARRLHHGRDLGEEFDFLTWFEFPPDATSAFDELLVRLRAIEEWAYVEREVEIRVSRTG